MRFLNYSALRDKGVPYTRVHLNRLINADKFPAPIALSNKRIAWVESEIDEWMARLVENRPSRQAA